MKIKNFLLFFSVLALTGCVPNAPMPGVSDSGNENSSEVITQAPIIKLNRERLFELLDKADAYCKSDVKKVDKYNVSQKYINKQTTINPNASLEIAQVDLMESHHEVDVDLGTMALKADFTKLISTDFENIKDKDEPVPPVFDSLKKRDYSEGSFITQLYGENTDTFVDLKDGKKLHYKGTVNRYGDNKVFSDFHGFDIYTQTIDIISQIKESIDMKDEMNPNGIGFAAYLQGTKCTIQLTGKGYGTADVVIDIQIVNNKLELFRETLKNTEEISMEALIEKIFTPKESITINVPDPTGYTLMEGSNPFLM